MHVALTVLATSGLATSGEAKKSGPIGFAVILLLGIACYFLFKSMSRHMRKVREQFPDGFTKAQAEPPASERKPVDGSLEQAPPDQAESVTHPADPPAGGAEP